MNYITVALAKGRLADTAVALFEKLGYNVAEMKEKTGLVIEGGGVRGIYAAGVLDVFLREGITFVITNRYADAPPPTTTPGGGKLPQTGQLWWPVPVLFAVGLALIVLGVARRREGGYEE